MKKLDLSGIVGWDIVASTVRDFLREAAGDPIEVRISSVGGLIGVGLEIFNLIRNYSGHKVCILSGYAMSMASYIPLAFDEIHTEDNAVYMRHNARGGVWGDHNDILNYGATLKGLSGVMARAYAKRLEKVGKTADLAAIVAEMDKETYHFGAEIVDAGYADLLIETSGDKDSDSAMAVAQAAFSECVARMAKESQAVREDLNRASAMLAMLDTGAAPSAVDTDVTPPASAGHSKQEVQHMSLKALLAANPAAQAEYDAAISAARTEGETAVKERVAAAAPFIGSDKYPKSVSETAVKVVTGEVPMSGLHTVVAAVDAVREEQAAQQAATASAAAPATPAPAAAPAVATEGLVSDDTSLSAVVAMHKTAEGRA